MIVHQPSFDAAGRGEVVVDGRRVEDPVRERAVVGGAVAVAGEDRADLGRGEAAVQVGDVLGGTLPGADDDEPGGRRALQRIDPGQQFGVVPDTVAALHALRHEGAQSGADDEVARPVEFQPLPRADRHLQVVHDSVPHDGCDTDDLVAVGDHVVDLGRGPLEVVVELDPQREQAFVVDEVDQPSLALQVAEEAVLAGRVPQGHQVLEEGHLHGRVVDQHAAVPAEARLLLEEAGVERLLPAGPCVVFADRDRHGDIGRSEADTDEVVDQR
ncbi:hypothetical protein STENM36S_01019 [Streptomyces tendae]